MATKAEGRVHAAGGQKAAPLPKAKGNTPEQALLGLLPAKRPIDVLDVGCSDCTEGEALIASGVRLSCVDRDEETLRRTARRLPEAVCHVGDAQSFRPADGTRFDAVLMRRPDLALQAHGWRQVLDRLGGWLAPDGVLVATTPGAAEADRLMAWLDEMGIDEKEEFEMGFEDETRAVVARGFKEPAADDKGRASSLADALSWDADPEAADEGAMVCDVRTGTCHKVTPSARK